MMEGPLSSFLHGLTVCLPITTIHAWHVIIDCQLRWSRHFLIGFIDAMQRELVACDVLSRFVA